MQRVLLLWQDAFFCFLLLTEPSFAIPCLSSFAGLPEMKNHPKADKRQMALCKEPEKR
jgi:hypothetical protein